MTEGMNERRRWSRRVILLGALGLMGILIVAGAAFAAWLTVRQTTEQSFTAAATGIDIGDVEGTELFSPATVAALTAGQSVEVCLIAEYAAVATDMQTAFFAVNPTGDALLMDNLYLKAERKNIPYPGAAPGRTTCTTTGYTAMNGSPLSTGNGGLGVPLSALTTDFASAVTAGHWLQNGPGTVAGGSGQGTWTEYRFTLQLKSDAPSGVAGQSASMGFAFAAQELP